ncbi:MAG: hypothetical protein ACPIOQ_20575, partial [Promethearchaeia archaeon]
MLRRGVAQRTLGAGTQAHAAGRPRSTCRWWTPGVWLAAQGTVPPVMAVSVKTRCLRLPDAPWLGPRCDASLVTRHQLLDTKSLSPVTRHS